MKYGIWWKTPARELNEWSEEGQGLSYLLFQDLQVKQGGAEHHRRSMDCFPELNENFSEYVSTSFLRFIGRHLLSPGVSQALCKAFYVLAQWIVTILASDHYCPHLNVFFSMSIKSFPQIITHTWSSWCLNSGLPHSKPSVFLNCTIFYRVVCFYFFPSALPVGKVFMSGTALYFSSYLPVPRCQAHCWHSTNACCFGFNARGL